MGLHDRAEKRELLLAAVAFVGSAAFAETPDSRGAMLRERFEIARQRGAGNAFGEPITLESTQTSDRLEGQIYARLDHSFSTIREALASPSHWCDILILHINVKYCRASLSDVDALDMAIGRKFEQPLSSALWAHFQFERTASDAEYLAVKLEAPTGPMSTRDHRIAIEATSLDVQRSVLHLSYSYSYGATARLAMRSYLATLGRSKVGFSVVGQETNGRPRLASGIRGLVERNAMRYFLAIDAYLGAYNATVPDRLTKRLEDWYSATERYPVQLHEVEREEYLEMKLHETQRARTELPPHHD